MDEEHVFNSHLSRSGRVFKKNKGNIKRSFFCTSDFNLNEKFRPVFSLIYVTCYLNLEI